MNQAVAEFNDAGDSIALSQAAVANVAFRRIAWRLIPFLQLCFVVASMDRINVSFARAQLAHDLQLSDAAYGLGAGLFFIGYVLFEVPSNLLMNKFGARRWLARIMVTWGFVSIAMAWVQSESSFYVLRFLLGVAEAGFAPGVLLYLTQWLPAPRRGRLFAIFLISLPLSGVVVAPLSGLILGTTDGLMGLHGWQWMFVLESIPAIVLGIAAWWVLPESPHQTTWLNAAERAAVAAELATDKSAARDSSFRSLLRERSVWCFGLAYFMLGVGVFGITFWLPTILNLNRSLTPMETGWISAAPYAFAVPAMLYAGVLSDRHRPLRVFVCVTTAGSVALAASALLLEHWFLLVISLVIAASGLLAGLPIFWRTCTSTMQGQAAAGGIAVVNSIGSLAGFAGPALVGAVKQASGGLQMPVLLIALICMFCALPLALAISSKHPVREPHS